MSSTGMPRKNSTTMIAGTRMIASRAVRAIEMSTPKISAPTAATPGHLQGAEDAAPDEAVERAIEQDVPPARIEDARLRHAAGVLARLRQQDEDHDEPGEDERQTDDRHDQ